MRRLNTSEKSKNNVKKKEELKKDLKMVEIEKKKFKNKRNA